MSHFLRHDARYPLRIALYFWFAGLCFPIGLCFGQSQGNDYRRQVESDWLKQAEAASLAGALAPGMGAQTPTWADAAGAVDGVKDGKYAFHTDREPNPWWQVDLGARQAVARIVVYNRLDYEPGLHNADNLLILCSDDGQKWTLLYDNPGKFFGGIGHGGPLTVDFEPAAQARFIRFQAPSQAPLWLHLDEVEVYGPSDLTKNLAFRKPTDQSSVSQWSTPKTKGLPLIPLSYPTGRAIRQGHALAAALRAMGVDTTAHKRELDAAVARLKTLGENAPEPERRALYFHARWAIRRLAFSNPLWDFNRLLFVKRFTQETYPDVCLNHMPWVSRPGGDLCVLTLEDPEKEPHVRNVLDGRLGHGHVHGADLWWDADRVVFGYAKAKSDQPPDGWMDRRTNFQLRRTEEPTHLFEIGIDGKNLRQLTDGEWSDLDPTYAPNGDIVFASERCGYSLQCNEYDKDETSCNLFSCRPDGSDIRWLSVSKDGDYLPHCLDDGTIAYTRWEYQERSFANIQSIWTIRPDGTQADALFKQHLNDPWALEDARSVPGASIGKLVAVATGHHTLAAGPIVVITPTVGMNSSEAIRIVTPGVYPPEGGMSGAPVDEGGVVDRGGFYMTPWPLSDRFFLASYSYGAAQTDPTGYALYLIDVFGTKELIYRDPEISSFTPIPLRPRSRPPILPDRTDRNVDYATCALSNATYGVEGIDSRSVRYIRISHRLAWPYDNRHGGQRYSEKAKPNNWTPVRVIGTVPLEPDGSAYFRVPTDTPVYFQLLDENHMELRRMRSFISFQPGEQRGCVGCHETRAEAPSVAVVSMALKREPSLPIPPPWGDRPISFLRDIQPIFDRQCVRCHTGLKPAGGLDFSGGLTAHDPNVPGYGHNRAFDTIMEHGLVSCSPVMGDASVTQPLQFGSHKSRLIQALRDGPCNRRAELDDEDWLRLVTWIDANAPYHDGFVNKRPIRQPYSLAGDRVLLDKITAIHARRCGSCHESGEVTRADWIDIHKPGQTLFLRAPLNKATGGTGQCDRPVYQDQADEDYQAILALLNSAVDKAWRYPRRDMQTLHRRNFK